MPGGVGPGACHCHSALAPAAAAGQSPDTSISRACSRSRQSIAMCQAGRLVVKRRCQTPRASKRSMRRLPASAAYSRPRPSMASEPGVQACARVARSAAGRRSSPRGTSDCRSQRTMRWWPPSAMKSACPQAARPVASRNWVSGTRRGRCGGGRAQSSGDSCTPRVVHGRALNSQQHGSKRNNRPLTGSSSSTSPCGPRATLIGGRSPPKLPAGSAALRSAPGAGLSTSACEPAPISASCSRRTRQPIAGCGPIQPASSSEYGSCGGAASGGTRRGAGRSFRAVSLIELMAAPPRLRVASTSRSAGPAGRAAPARRSVRSARRGIPDALHRPR